MSVLFSAERHEPLHEAAWDPAAARTAIARIAAAARSAFTGDGFWPIHPRDADAGPGPLTSLYDGAAGVIWALDHLAREGAADATPELGDHFDEVQHRNRRALEADAMRTLLGADWQTRSLLLGDAGVIFAEWRNADAGAAPALLETLAATIEDNTHDVALELMWGAPGTMLVALALYRYDGDARWADLYRAGADALEASFAFDADLGADIWTQTLYGRRARYLGAVHGFAGNAFALIRGRDLLPTDRWRALSARLARTLEVTANRDEAGASWDPTIGWDRVNRQPLVQHCHGAPGMITALSGLDQPIDALLLDAGRLTWTAGPLAKGANLCHGTAGNAYAFLKLFERTGDDLWLTRARAFAMHAIAQSDADAAALGRPHFSLWTGDLGLACFLWECLRASSRFPTMDAF